MLKAQFSIKSALAALLVVSSASAAFGQAGQTAAGHLKSKSSDDDPGEITKFCANIARDATEARAAWQMARLKELQAQVLQDVANLKAKEDEAREWIAKRDAMQRKAADDVVQVYAKMQAEAAASQLSTMDEANAAAILTKLNARIASAILNEMDAQKAAKLANLMMGAANGKGT